LLIDYSSAAQTEQARHEIPSLNLIKDMIEKGYNQGTPKHLLPSARSLDFDATASTIFVVPYTQFTGMQDKKIHEIFRNRHILVTGVPVAPLAFDENGLSTLAPLHQKTLFQGES